MASKEMFGALIRNIQAKHSGRVPFRVASHVLFYRMFTLLMRKGGECRVRFLKK